MSTLDGSKLSKVQELAKELGDAIEDKRDDLRHDEDELGAIASKLIDLLDDLEQIRPDGPVRDLLAAAVVGVGGCSAVRTCRCGFTSVVDLRDLVPTGTPCDACAEDNKRPLIAGSGR